MTFGEFLLALFLALMVAAVLIPLGGYRGRTRQSVGSAFLFFFLIIFFFVLAGGIWTRPYGPAIGGVFWVPFLFWAIVIGLLIAAVSSPDEDIDRERTDTTTPGVRGDRDLEETSEVAVATGAFGLFFFGLLIVLIIAAVVAAFD